MCSQFTILQFLMDYRGRWVPHDFSFHGVDLEGVGYHMISCRAVDDQSEGRTSWICGCV